MKRTDVERKRYPIYLLLVHTYFKKEHKKFKLN